MKIDSLQFEDQSNELTVNLCPNPFKKDSYIGKIARQTVTLNTLARRIKENDTGLSDYTIFNVAGQLKKECLKALKRGQAVNILGLGTIYIIPNGSISAASPRDALSKKLTLRFTPSEDALSAVSDVKINLIPLSDSSPKINMIESLPKGNDGEVFAGRITRISGDKLRIAGDGSGIFLYKTDENGEIINESEIRISEDFVIRNTRSLLEFYIPDDIESGEYRIKLLTRFLAKDLMRKSLESALSNIITIRA
ncbi:MAG: DUF4469 domain-containing protein [Treponema sp.]|nr:DUF4469 domain-containing protein [Treponema sp.]